MRMPVTVQLASSASILALVVALAACSATSDDTEAGVDRTDDSGGILDTGGAGEGDGIDDDGTGGGDSGEGGGDAGEGDGQGGDDAGEGDGQGGDDAGENGDQGADDAGENGDQGGDGVGDDTGEHGDDARDIPVDMDPREFCELSLHSLTQFSGARCLTFPEEFILEPGEHVVIGRDATPDEFRTCYPDFPAVTDTDWQDGGAFFYNEELGIYYIDSSAAVWAIDGGLPLIDGDETFEVRDEPCEGGLGFQQSGADALGEGERIESRTTDIPGPDFYNLDRLVPIRSARPETSWDILFEGGRLISGVPNPGFFVAFDNPDLVISEISHADEGGECSFLEITCPFDDVSAVGSCCVPQEGGPPDACVPANNAAECIHNLNGVQFYPPGAVCNPVCSDPYDPPPEECCLLNDEGPADDVCAFLDRATCLASNGLPRLSGQCVPNLPCSEIDIPPDPMCCLPGSPVGQCLPIGQLECEGSGGIFSPGGACDPTDCPLEGPPQNECCVYGETEGDDACISLAPNADCAGPILAAGTCTTPCPRVPVTGACCRLEEGDCAEGLFPDECARSGGLFHPGKTCAEADCRGACCDDDGTCNIVTRGDCSLRHGDWQGLRTTCDPNPCPAPDGGCCDSNGDCVARTEEACSLRHGEWLGAVVACSDGVSPGDPDPACLGACCDQSTGECAQVIEDDCRSDGAVWHGVGSSCDDVTCDPEPGACCTEGVCTSSILAACDGEWLGVGAVCEADICKGACCNQITGECTLLDEGSCQSDGDTWHGRGSRCADVTCGQTVGACCAESGACELTSSEDCSLGHGDYLSGTACSEGLCLGACCNRQEGECVGVISEAACRALGDGHTWGGRGSTCDSLSCLKDSDLDGIPDTTDNCINVANPGQADSGGETTGGNSGDMCESVPIDPDTMLPDGGTFIGTSDDGCSALFAADDHGTASCETCTNSCWGGCTLSRTFRDGLVSRTVSYCSTILQTVSCNCTEDSCSCVGAVDCLAADLRIAFLEACGTFFD